MRINELVALHKKVIHGHGESFSEFDMYLEDKWVKIYPYDTLNNVCSDCFSTPEE